MKPASRVLRHPITRCRCIPACLDYDYSQRNETIIQITHLKANKLTSYLMSDGESSATEEEELDGLIGGVRTAGKKSDGPCIDEEVKEKEGQLE